MTGLASLDCKIWLVTLYEEHKDSWIDRFREAGVNLYQLRVDHKHLLNAVKKLERFIVDHRIDILHSSGMSADLVNCLVRESVLKVNTVRQEFGALAEGKNYFKKKLSRSVTLFNHRAMDVRVACSKALQNHLNSYSRLCYECVENGVDVDKYKVVDLVKKNSIRKRLGIDKDTLIYLSVGVLYTRKQTLALAKAFNDLSLSNAELIIVGDGVEMGELKILAENSTQIRLIGKVIDPLEFYQCADIFVSASLAEGLPNTVMEAMACGLPCILSDIGPHKEILNYDNNAGSLYETGNIQKLKQALLDSSNWNLSEMSTCAHELVYENLSKYSTAKKYYSLYKRTINE